MILNSNTVIKPRTVVVKPLYTSITNCTVFASFCSNNLTVWA